MSDDKLMNRVAESALLGALLLDNKLITLVSDRVTASDFTDAVHGRIFQAAMRMHAVGKAATALTLRPAFMMDPDCQYGDYLGHLVEERAVVGMADGLAEQIADLAARRKVRDALREQVVSITEDLDVPIEEITGRVEAAGYAATAGTAIEQSVGLGDMIGSVEEREEKRDSEGGAGLENRLIEELQMGLGAIETGTYNLIAGRPGMGKTAAALSLAHGYAMNGHPGCYINCEMKQTQLGMRSLSDLSHAMEKPLEHSLLRDGNYDHYTRSVIQRVKARAELLPLQFYNVGRVNVRRIWTMIAREKARLEALDRKLEFVVIDYIGLLSVTDDKGRAVTNGYERMSAISQAIKQMAFYFDVAIFALAQLSRGVEQRENKRPMMSDLRESGELEQDADTITLLYREEYYLEQMRPQPGEKPKDSRMTYEEWETAMHQARERLDFIFAKNRHGTVGTKTVKFLPKFSAVRSLSFDEFTDAALFS